MRRVVFLVGLILLVALALAACTPTPTPVPTPAPAPDAEPTVAPDPNAPVKVNSARAIIDVVDDKDAILAALSPDGKYLAYFLAGDRKTASQICLYIFDGAAKKCSDLPLDAFLGYPYQLQWSPDSSKIAFTENPIDLGYDGDIWVLNVADGSVKNLTDDGVAGSWVMPTGTPSQVVDYLPMWNPNDGKIYFWRFQNQGEYQKFTLGLYSIDPAGGEPVLAVDVAAQVPVSIPLFHQEEFYLDGPSAMSPDGKSVGVLLSTPSDMGYTDTGLYVIALDGSGANKLMDGEAFQAALPDWQDYPSVPMGLAWTSDGKGLLAMGATSYDPEPFTVFYHADVASGAVTPVVDFSTLPSRDAYTQPWPGTEIPARWFSPWTGSLSPKGDKLLTVNDLTGVAGLMSSNLPPTGAVPAISATTDESTMSTASRSSRSADGKVTIYGLLLTVTE
jgi:hypothetical protein